jgi:hypothetical protein
MPSFCVENEEVEVEEIEGLISQPLHLEKWMRSRNPVFCGDVRRQQNPARRATIQWQ